MDVVELKYVKRFLADTPTHTLSYYDITLITEGQGAFSIDCLCDTASPRDVFFSKPGETRHWDTRRIVNGYALIFEEEFLSSFFKDSMFVRRLSFFDRERTAVKLPLSDELHTRILRLLHDIKAEIDSYRDSGVDVLRALLYEALILLNRTYKESPLSCQRSAVKGSGRVHIQKFTELVAANLKERHSVQYYADRLCVTPNYLNEMVTSTLGVSAKQYIHHKVMDEAKRLLIHTDLSVSDIAFELHFSTTSYFVRSFRRHTGRTPLCYRTACKP